MAINRSLALLAFALSLMITMISSVAHCYSQQNDVVSSTSSSAINELSLPIFARVRAFGSIRCGIPQERAARSTPLVANVDGIVFCGDNRIAAAQTLSKPSGAFDFTFDIARSAVSDPLELAKCIAVVTFPGGACGADLSPAGRVVRQVLAGGQTYYVPVYKAQEFHPYH